MKSRQLIAIALSACLLLAPLGCSDSELTPAPQAVPPNATGTPSAPPSAGATSSVAPTRSVESSVSALVAAPLVYAVIGDYGTDDSHERAVARIVASWKPSFVITTGDDYYKVAGGRGTGKYDESTGAHYFRYLKDINTTGSRAPKGKAATNSFFPSLGNHDYSDATPSLKTYLTYFRLPGSGYRNTSGNERYYDYVRGSVHFFVLNSNKGEPDGTSSSSKQGKWLKKQLAASKSRWNVVYDHHPPYCSDSTHGSSTYMRWPFAAWGADVVFSGHAHVYERIVRNGIPYFVNGTGGASRYRFGKPVSGSKKRYRSNWGAQKVTVTPASMRFDYYNVDGERIDTYTIR